MDAKTAILNTLFYVGLMQTGFFILCLMCEESQEDTCLMFSVGVALISAVDMAGILAYWVILGL